MTYLIYNWFVLTPECAWIPECFTDCWPNSPHRIRSYQTRPHLIVYPLGYLSLAQCIQSSVYADLIFRFIIRLQGVYLKW